MYLTTRVINNGNLFLNVHVVDYSLNSYILYTHKILYVLLVFRRFSRNNSSLVLVNLRIK